MRRFRHRWSIPLIKVRSVPTVPCRWRRSIAALHVPSSHVVIFFMRYSPHRTHQAACSPRNQGQKVTLCQSHSRSSSTSLDAFPGPHRARPIVPVPKSGGTPSPQTHTQRWCLFPITHRKGASGNIDAQHRSRQKCPPGKFYYNCATILARPDLRQSRVDGSIPDTSVSSSRATKRTL